MRGHNPHGKHMQTSVVCEIANKWSVRLHDYAVCCSEKQQSLGVFSRQRVDEEGAKETMDRQ